MSTVTSTSTTTPASSLGRTVTSDALSGMGRSSSLLGSVVVMTPGKAGAVALASLASTNTPTAHTNLHHTPRGRMRGKQAACPRAANGPARANAWAAGREPGPGDAYPSAGDARA